MDFFKCFLKQYWSYVLNGVLLLVLIFVTGYCWVNSEKQETVDIPSIAVVTEDEEIVAEKIYVDIKGAVKKPGVYEMDAGTIINDAITAAGGFTSKAYKNNINLSKRLSDELVIYVYTKTEYKKLNEESVESTTVCDCSGYYIDSCTDEGASVITSNGTESSSTVGTSQESTESGKISLNSATKEELMTLSGIGEAKAESIIKYREETNGFKSIEEIKNVSGIGEAAYEKIKDYITI